jgi:replication-associated recombination protein RarA
LSVKKPKNHRQGELYAGPSDVEAEQAVGETEKTIRGVPFSAVMSGFQKSVRASDEEAALHWGLLLYQRAPFVAWRRLIVTACEDVGLADLDVVTTVHSLAAGWAAVASGSRYVSPHSFTLATMLVARAPKSTYVEDTQTLALERIRRGHQLPVLPHFLDMHTAQGKAAGKGDVDWYRDRHFVTGVPINEATLKLWAEHPEWDPRPPGGAE